MKENDTPTKSKGIMLYKTKKTEERPQNKNINK